MLPFIRATLAALALLAATHAPTARAAPPTACREGAIDQSDLAGRYASPTLTLEVFPCGGFYVEWLDVDSWRAASYRAIRRLPSGSVVAEGFWGDPQNDAYLDEADRLLIRWRADTGTLEVVPHLEDRQLRPRYALLKVP